MRERDERQEAGREKERQREGGRKGEGGRGLEPIQQAPRSPVRRAQLPPRSVPP